MLHNHFSHHHACHLLLFQSITFSNITLRLFSFLSLYGGVSSEWKWRCRRWENIIGHAEVYFMGASHQELLRSYKHQVDGSRRNRILNWQAIDGNILHFVTARDGMRRKWGGWGWQKQKKKENCKREKNIGSWELMVVIKGLCCSEVAAIIEDQRNSCQWHYSRTNPSGKNCCCTKHYEEVEKRSEEEKIYSNFLFQHFFFVLAFFVRRVGGGCELKYFHTHSSLQTPTAFFFPFNRCCWWNGIHWRWEWIEREEQRTLMGKVQIHL